METDLDKLAGLNNLRADFLESVASSNYLSPDECKRKADEDTSAIAKFQNLLKKTKEIKVKNGKPKALKNDANALPW
jgi:phage portal protein BeeE